MLGYFVLIGVLLNIVCCEKSKSATSTLFLRTMATRISVTSIDQLFSESFAEPELMRRTPISTAQIAECGSYIFKGKGTPRKNIILGLTE